MKIRTVSTVALVLLSAGLLAACQEQPQVINGASRTPDSVPWKLGEGANKAYLAEGWAASGDKTAWLDHLQERTQGQNEYSRR